MTKSYLQTCPKGRAFRLSCNLSEIEVVEKLLIEEGFVFCSVQFSEYGRVLIHEPKPLGQSIAAQFGLIYIQDKASMLPPLYLRPDPGSTVLDMCASPGGKTGILSQLVGDYGLVLANEPKQNRLQTLRATAQRHNLINVITTCYPGEDFPEYNGSFEAILLDVPCSGWGTADKHPKVLNLWTENNLSGLLALQKKLLSKAAKLLAPGGLLLYSTCTTNSRENEGQIEWILKNSGLSPVDLDCKPDFCWDPVIDDPYLGCLRVNGRRSHAQSFFLACLQKSETSDWLEENMDQDYRSIAGSKKTEKGFEEVSLPSQLREKLPPGKVVRLDNQLYFHPKQALSDISPGIKWRGFQLGQINKSHIRLSTRLRYILPPPEEKESYVVTETTILHKLLSGQSLPVSTKAKALALYWHHLPLGWLTVKGGRCLWSESAVPIG